MRACIILHIQHPSAGNRHFSAIQFTFGNYILAFECLQAIPFILGAILFILSVHSWDHISDQGSYPGFDPGINLRNCLRECLKRAILSRFRAISVRSGLLPGSNQWIDSGLPLWSCALCYPEIDPGVDHRMIPCDHSYRRVDPGCDHGSDLPLD